MSTDRYDIYRLIHKGLRAFMTETLLEVGRLDGSDLIAVSRVCGEVRALLAFCASHLDKEETYVHPALEARAPGSAATTAQEHRHHHGAIAALSARVDGLVTSDRHDRDTAIHALYLELSLFIADNLIHMQEEERLNNATLWAHYSDAEILDIERQIVSAIPPADQQAVLRWIVPSVTPAERAGFLQGVRQGVPAPVFQDIQTFVSGYLSSADAAALNRSLSSAA